MTIKQYQNVAKAIATKIEELGGNPNHVRHLHINGATSIKIRDPKQYNNQPTSITSGDGNVVIEFDTLSNPNNPNYKFRTLKPGSMSVYNSETGINVDITEYNFDSAQFADFIDAINTTNWSIRYQ